MYLNSQLEHALHNFSGLFFTAGKTILKSIYPELIKIKDGLHFWPVSCTGFFIKIRKGARETAFKTMFKYYFEEQYCLRTTIKRGALLYLVLALLIMPSAMCSEQHDVLAFASAFEAPPGVSFPVWQLHRDHEMALLDNAIWDGSPAGGATGSDQLQAGTDASDEPPFDLYIMEAAEAYQIEAALIKAIIMAESSYNPRAVSHRGAQGLMQLMPNTARWLGVDDAFDPRLNIDAGVRYLRRLLDRFKGDVELALAAYNAGSRYVRKYGGIPPFRATRNYVRKVLQLRDGYLKEMADLQPALPAV